MLQQHQPVAISAMGGIGKTELALQYALRYSQIDVGAKHLGDNLLGKPKILYPNASPSQDLGDNLSGKPKVLYPNASPSQDLGDNLSDKPKVLDPNASPSPGVNPNPNLYTGGVCWLLARGLDLGIQIVDFARVYLGLNPPEDFDLQQRVAYCWRNWIAGDVLVVLDDVTDYEKVKPYLPPREARFKVLMTTRLELSAPIVRLDLQVLTGEAALDLLKSLIGEERIGAELEVGENICKWLGYLPLGLELVGRYLRRKLDLSLAEMLYRLEAKRLQQLGLKKPKSEATMTGQLGVRDAFELSWLELDESGQELGLYLSLFALAPIPWQLVEECLPDIDSEELEETRDYSLLNLHLIQRSEKDTYQLHPLIREFLIAKGEELGIADDWKRGFCQVMVGKAQEIPHTPTLEDIEKVNLAIPHIAAAATSQQDWLMDDNLIWPFVGLGRFYEGKGNYQEAVPWREDCLSVTRKRLGENHPDVAASLNNLASLYDNQGKYDQAELLSLESLELRKRLLGENHPDVATSLNNLALLYNNQGKYDQAEPLYLESLELSKRLLGENHPAVATSLNNLAGLYKNQGKYDQAEPLYKESLELRKRLLGENHPDVATSLNNLAGLYDNQGKYDQAEPLYLESLELSKRLLGENHPAVATSLNNLALLYKNQGKYDQAEPLYLESLELMKHLLGENHPAVATSLNNLARLYDNQGKYDQAEPLYLESLELRKRLLGENHPYVATSLNNLAILYDHQGKYDEAEPLYLQAVEIAERTLGNNHPNTITIRNNLQILRDR